MPDGVEVRDAAQILAEDRVIFHRNGSVALFADWFRYELQMRALGTWVDTDTYLIAPLDMARPYLFGKQVVDRPAASRRRQRESIAAGVLRLPPDSPMLPSLLSPFETRKTPTWLPWHWYLRARLRELITGRGGIERLPWGTAGPFALTALARRHGLSSEASPSDVFNPAPWYQADWIRNPAIGLEDMVTERSVGVHLWNECIKGFKNRAPPQGSFLERLHSEGAD